jgi:hypothetical protein
VNTYITTTMPSKKPTPMKTTPPTHMKILVFGLFATFAATNLHAQESGLRTDWSGRGKNSIMQDPLNWSNGLPTEATICVVKRGELLLGAKSGSADVFTCSVLTFQEDEDKASRAKSLDIEGELILKDRGSRWPVNGSLQVHQSGGIVSAPNELFFAVKPESELDYELEKGSLTVGKLLTGNGKTSFKQTGGKVEADDIYLGGAGPGTTEYVISEGSLKFGKLVLGKGDGAATLTVSGIHPVVAGEELHVMPKGTLVFVSDASGVATVGSPEGPLSKANLNGTIAFRHSGTSPARGKVVNLIYSTTINADGLVLDPENAAKWDLIHSKSQKCSALGLEAK